MLASGYYQRARDSGCLGMGRGSRKTKPLTLDLFHILPNVKLFSPSDHIATQVLWLPLSQNVHYLPSKGYEEQLQDTVKGFAPKSPSSVPLKKGESLSCQYLSVDTQEIVGVTNCPRVPAHFLPPVPSVSSTRGGGKDNRHLQKEDKTPHSTQRGAENQLSPIPQNMNDARDNCASLKLGLHSERARVQLLQGLSKWHAKDNVPPSPARKVDLNPGLHIEEHPTLPPNLCPLLLTQLGEHTARLFLLWRSRTKATAGFAAQEAPTAKPGY